MNEFNAVKEFMIACDQKVPVTPQVPNKETIQLRITLIEEEVTELIKDLYKLEFFGGPKNQADKLKMLARIADHVADVVYVVNGTAAAFGIDGEAAFNIVHAANMQKANGPRREDGKVMKPEGWVSPEIKLQALIQTQWNSYVAPAPTQEAGVWCEGEMLSEC